MHWYFKGKTNSIVAYWWRWGSIQRYAFQQGCPHSSRTIRCLVVWLDISWGCHCRPLCAVVHRTGRGLWWCRWRTRSWSGLSTSWKSTSLDRQSRLIPTCCTTKPPCQSARDPNEGRLRRLKHQHCHRRLKILGGTRQQHFRCRLLFYCLRCMLHGTSWYWISISLGPPTSYWKIRSNDQIEILIP